MNREEALEKVAEYEQEIKRIKEKYDKELEAVKMELQKKKDAEVDKYRAKIRFLRRYLRSEYDRKRYQEKKARKADAVTML